MLLFTLPVLCNKCLDAGITDSRGEGGKRHESDVQYVGGSRGATSCPSLHLPREMWPKGFTNPEDLDNFTVDQLLAMRKIQATEVGKIPKYKDQALPGTDMTSKEVQPVLYECDEGGDNAFDILHPGRYS